jgi:adenylate cyclase
MSVQVLTGARLHRAARPPVSDGERLYRSTVRRLAWTLPVASIDGASLVFFCVAWVLPRPAMADPHAWELRNLVVFACYLAFSVTVGSICCNRLVRSRLGWLREGRRPTDVDVQRLLRLPLIETAISGAMWLGAAAIFAVVDWGLPRHWALAIVVAIVLGGLSNCALDYLLTERLLRPVFAAALDANPQVGGACGRVAPRMALTWAFTTAVPMLGIGLAVAANGRLSVSRMIWPVCFLVALALVTGAAGTYIATRSVSDPVAALRDAMSRVAQGDVAVAVDVYDGSELGALQAGFNDMVEGLRERRTLQDLFGRHVGDDVARRALQRGVELGGETLDVAVLFVDVRGSTTLASTRPAHEVVGALNEFFAAVVEVVTSHGGWVNKFEGDGALCVFGAPLPRADAPTAALAAARELRRRLAASTSLDAGIGVAAGPVVAGNVGAESRYEYTVIGDAVNEAARLTDLAKQHPGRVLASADALELADPAEAALWEVGGSERLRGRDRVTVLARPLVPQRAVPAQL